MTHITYVCKRDNQVSTASLSMEYPKNVIKYTGSPDTILLRYYDSQYGKLGLLSLPDEKFETLSLNLGPHSYFLCCNSHYIVGAEEHQAGCEIWIYNVKTCQVNKVPVPFGVTAFHKIAAISDEKLYLWAGSPHYSADTKDNILDVIDYKNSGACVAQMKFKPMDLECLFDPQKWYFMGHDPNQILVYKNYVLVPMYRQINRSAANSTRAIVFCLIDPHEREIVKTIDPSPSFPFGLMGGQEQELILYKEKLIVVDPFVGICTVDLETAETSIMVEQRTFFSGIIGPYLYFSDNNYRSSKFRINIDNPSMVENIP